MGRLVSAGTVIHSQVDLYNPPGSITRQPGVQPIHVAMKAFVNGTELGWTLEDGSSVVDSSIAAGSVYFNEIAAEPGFYVVRFFADRVGFWRIVLTVSMVQSEPILEFDIIASGALKPGGSGGLNASFVKP